MKKVITVPQGEVPTSPPNQRDAQIKTQMAASPSVPHLEAEGAADSTTEPRVHGSVPAGDPGKKQDQVNHIGEHLLGRDLGNGIPDRMLSSRETAFMLNMSPSWLNKQRVSGGEDAIPFHKLGRRVQYHPRDVRIALLKARRLSSPAW